jgi:hypothetical protein
VREYKAGTVLELNAEGVMKFVLFDRYKEVN